MKVNIKEINKVINLKWDECCDYELEKDTKDFVNTIVNRYYDKVSLGLMDHSYADEYRKTNY